MQPFVSRQLLLFILTGGTAAGVNFGTRIIYNHWMSFSLSVLCAYLTGMLTAFILAKLFVFKQSQQSLNRSAIYFTLINIIAVFQTWTISLGLINYVFPFIGLRSFVQEMAHGIGLIVPVFTSYFGHKHFSFK